MKKLLMVLLLAASASLASAQTTLSVGPVLGANYSWLSEMESDGKRKIGFATGGQLTCSNTQGWGIGAALLYSREGAEVEVGDEALKTNLTYLRLPLKGILFFRLKEDSFRPKIFLGPSFGYLLGGEAESVVGGVEVDVKDTFKNFDAGLLGGLGFNARISEATWFNFDLGYTYGLMNISEAGGDVSNRGIHATAGVSWGIN